LQTFENKYLYRNNNIIMFVVRIQKDFEKD